MALDSPELLYETHSFRFISMLSVDPEGVQAMKTPKVFLGDILAYRRQYTIGGHDFTKLLTDHESNVTHRPSFIVLTVATTGTIEVIITTGNLIFNAIEECCINKCSRA
jgi:hypothetical protein